MMFKRFKQKRFLNRVAKEMQHKCWFQELQVRKQDQVVRYAIREANKIAEMIEKFKSDTKGEKKEKNDNLAKKKIADERVVTESNSLEALNKQLQETEADLAETLLYLKNF